MFFLILFTNLLFILKQKKSPRTTLLLSLHFFLLPSPSPPQPPPQHNHHHKTTMATIFYLNLQMILAVVRKTDWWGFLQWVSLSVWRWGKWVGFSGDKVGLVVSWVMVVW